MISSQLSDLLEYMLICVLAVLGRNERLVETGNIQALFSSPYDWRVVAVEDRPFGDNRGFYLCKKSLR